VTAAGDRPGRLVLVATPIGNLGDLAPRGRSLLAEADLICCEDTRRTRALLAALGVPAGGATGDRLLSLHGHNEHERIPRVLAALEGGGTVAVVSDAGTPGISDPGAALVEAAIGGGYAVSTVPGPSSVLGALVVSGLRTERFCVEGFLPRKGAARRGRLDAVLRDPRTTVVLEAPGRVVSTLRDLAAADPRRRVAVVRELTKVHEEVWRGTVDDAVRAFEVRPPRGEVVLVVDGAPAPAPVADEALAEAVRARLDEGRAGEGSRHVADALAAELGVGRRRVYEMVLRIRAGS